MATPYKPKFQEDTRDERLNTILKEKLTKIFEPIIRDYNLYREKDKFLHTPHSSVDGYWAWTDGGIKIEGYTTVDNIIGTEVPDSVLREAEKYQQDAIEEAKRQHPDDEEAQFDEEQNYLSDISYSFGIAAHLYVVGGNSRSEETQDRVNVFTYISSDEYRHYHGMPNQDIFFEQDIPLEKKEDGSYNYEKFSSDFDKLAKQIQASFSGKSSSKKEKIKSLKTEGYKSKFTEAPVMAKSPMGTQLADMALPGFTWQELVDTVYSNFRKEDITRENVMKTMREMINYQVNDAIHVLRNEMMDEVIEVAIQE